MKVQTVVFKSEACREQELYIRKKGEIAFEDNAVKMNIGSMFTTDTYINVFDAGVWYRYTGIKDWKLKVNAVGKGVIKLMCLAAPDIIIKSHALEETLEISFECKNDKKLFYFMIEAVSNVTVHDIYYEADMEVRNEIYLGAIICTYKREKELYRNIEIIKKSRFFDKTDELYGKLNINIVDNSSVLPLINEENITLYHNPNTGGAGGFLRGMEEVRKKEKDINTTNVILMDDDVIFIMESFYRLYALLSYITDKYKREVIAGRMFRMDNRCVQYTATEKWNGGNIIHSGFNLDMTKKENIYTVNNADGEYTGWWFGCFPMDFVRKNNPLPFFLHCDDVEYGLRHGGTPIVLNGIQVWHETYEYRQSPVIAYYDMRNSLLVNKLYGYMPIKHNLFRWWHIQIAKIYACKDKNTRKLMLLGLWDYFRGIKYLEKTDSANKHKVICNKVKEKRERGQKK